MKKILFLALCGFMSFTSFAQGLIDLTVKWNATQSRYEVYARPNFTSASFTWGPSQVTVVVPATAPDALLTINSVNAGGWSLNTSNQVFAPAASPNNDFNGVQSSGQSVALTANQETLLFTFTFSDGQCRDGVRLFVNSSDRSSSASGMKGGDYKNAIDNGMVADVYNINFNNTGTTCTTCSITAPELIK
jgi:hypothetical protein